MKNLASTSFFFFLRRYLVVFALPGGASASGQAGTDGGWKTNKGGVGG